MKSLNSKLQLIILLFAICSLFCCKHDLTSNEFNIYVSEDNPGWHLIDLSPDTIHKGYQKIDIKFDKGQTFKTAIIRSNLNDYQLTFLSDNGDTIKSGLWFAGEYSYGPFQRRFLHYYMPNAIQRKTIKDFMKDPSYDSLRFELDNIIENYLRQRHEIK
jgi:hypothetical protein